MGRSTRILRLMRRDELSEGAVLSVIEMHAAGTGKDELTRLSSGEQSGFGLGTALTDN